ncbi:MAG: HD domain-containing protein [Ruminiclostridium sp.]|nr:HD domain-containing protein [Ruminiclostridium sp.]
MRLPEYVYEILDKLCDSGYEAYCVGGCVRDYLLGQCPDDYDITTSALPEQIMKVFDGYKLLTVGLKHGTVTVIIDRKTVEITTYRVDGNYTDHRHPSEVHFTPCLEEDLARRDLTINAMAYSPEKGIIDPFGGQEDLRSGIIRCVGDPMKRFDEDGLRILRALRFASRYGFRIDKDTSDAVHRLRYLLSCISAERINYELCGILTGNCGDILYNYSDVICEIIPEMYPCIGFEQHSKYHNKTVYGHIIATVAASEPTVEARLTMLLHDIGKPASYFMKEGVGHFYGHADVSCEMATKIIERLRFSNKIADEVLFLIKNHGIVINDDTRSIRRGLARYGAERFLKLIRVHYYDTCGKAPAYFGEKDLFDSIEKHTKEYLESEPPMSLKQLAVNGSDISKLGITSKKIGEVLGFLLEQVIDGNCENDRDSLIALIRNKYL